MQLLVCTAVSRERHRKTKHRRKDQHFPFFLHLCYVSQGKKILAPAKTILNLVTVHPKAAFLAFVRSGRPKRTRSGQFKRKVQDARVHFPRHNSPNSRPLADRGGRTERL